MRRIKITVSDEVYDYFHGAKEISGISISKLVADVLEAHVNKAGSVKGIMGSLSELLNELKSL
jgi:hypothetical protein